MSRARDFENDRRNRIMIERGVENVEGTYTREGLSRSGTRRLEPKAGMQKAGLPIGQRGAPKSKSPLIPRGSEEGKQLEVRGFGKMKTRSDVKNALRAARSVRSSEQDGR
jgi:hypothetical protein